MPGLILTMPDGTKVELVGEVTAQAIGTAPPEPIPEPPSEFAIDFKPDFSDFPVGHNFMDGDEWDIAFAQGIEQGAEIYCLEQNTDAKRHDFFVEHGKNGSKCLQTFMPKGSFGMGHRSVNVRLGRVAGPVNVSYNFMVEDAGTNLFVNGGGKWGPAIQYGPIQSGTTGGIRFMPTWAAGASTLGKQDLTCSIQNQPDGGQWLQPPYYGFRPIQVGHWYSIRMRMIGGSGDEPTTVQCQYWKDSDPEMNYVARTTNHNAVQGSAEVMIDITSFFGGTEANKAPADARFRYDDLRIWVEA